MAIPLYMHLIMLSREGALRLPLILPVPDEFEAIYADGYGSFARKRR